MEISDASNPNTKTLTPKARRHVVLELWGDGPAGMAAVRQRIVAFGHRVFWVWGFAACHGHGVYVVSSVEGVGVCYGFMGLMTLDL